MNLKLKNEFTLLSELKVLVSKEREVTAQILHYFREVESRKLHLESGYPSLFEFAVKELGYSAGSAHRRISAMSLLKVLPEIEEQIQSGELSLSVAAQAQSFFREEGRSRTVSVEEKKETVASLMGLSTRECERKLAAISPLAALPRERERVVTEDLTQIQFLADRELMEKLEKLKGLLAHRNFDGGYRKLFHALADMALKKLVPVAKQGAAKGEVPKHLIREQRVQNKQTTKEIATPAQNESERQVRMQQVRSNERINGAKRSRSIPVQVRAAVYKRDQGKCSYVDRKSGRTCASIHALEYDHITPFMMGGEATQDNLRLLCSAHHRLETEKLLLVV